MFEEGGHKFLAHEHLTGGPDYKEKRRAQDRAYKEAAKAQIAWEEKARREAEEWRQAEARPDFESRRDNAT
jgi:hypothetical protein